MKRVVTASLASVLLLAACKGTVTVTTPAPPQPSAAASPATADTTQPTTGFKTYTNSQYGFSIQYPAGWTEGEGVSGTVVSFMSEQSAPTDVFKESANVTTEDLSASGASLAEYIVAANDQIKNAFPNAQVISDTDRQIAGIDGHAITYTAETQGVTLELIQAFTVKDDRAYVITAASTEEDFPQFEEDFNAIIDSFQLT